MAGRHLKEMFAAFQCRDELAFRRAALEVIEEVQGKHHYALGRDLQRLLAAGGGATLDSGDVLVLLEPPMDRSTTVTLNDVVHMVSACTGVGVGGLAERATAEGGRRPLRTSRQELLALYVL